MFKRIQNEDLWTEGYFFFRKKSKEMAQKRANRGKAGQWWLWRGTGWSIKSVFQKAEKAENRNVKNTSSLFIFLFPSFSFPFLFLFLCPFFCFPNALYSFATGAWFKNEGCWALARLYQRQEHGSPCCFGWNLPFLVSCKQCGRETSSQSESKGSYWFPCRRNPSLGNLRTLPRPLFHSSIRA